MKEYNLSKSGDYSYFELSKLSAKIVFALINLNAFNYDLNLLSAMGFPLF